MATHPLNPYRHGPMGKHFRKMLKRRIVHLMKRVRFAYVGVGGHPAYAENFVGRNSAMDLVGDAYKIEPTSFIDVSHDVLKVALDLTKKEQNAEHLANRHPKLLESARMMPASFSGFTRFADSNPLAHSRIIDQAAVDRLKNTHNNYRPWRIFTSLWRLILSVVYSKENNQSRSSLNVRELAEKNSLSVSQIEQGQLTLASKQVLDKLLPVESRESTTLNLTQPTSRMRSVKYGLN